MEKVERKRLLGISATLNLIQAHLNTLGSDYKPAAIHANGAVVEIHKAAGWTADELVEMGEVQMDLARRIIPDGDG